MQAAIFGTHETPEHGWLETDEQEQAVTFQVALVGCDGVVIGSDRLGKYVPVVAGISQLPQLVLQPKYCVSDDESMACFAAGGNAAINLARQIRADCDPTLKLKDATESGWEEAIRRLAAVPTSWPSSSQIADEILVTRKDVCDAFWIVLRRPGTPSTVLKMQHQCFCTGTSTVAQFLPRHLYTPKRSVPELKKLALLTLTFAAKEEPSSVSAPFDIMTLDRSGYNWSVHDPINEKFQSGMERLFMNCEIPERSLE
jgi:hypothetical protein